MKQVRLPFKFWILFGIALLLNGCGYHLVGTGSSLPSHLKTPFITMSELPFRTILSLPSVMKELIMALVNPR